MRALLVDGPNRIAARDVPFTPMAGECTVRVLMAGICGTDLQLLEGYAEFGGIPGHEFVGVVERVSDLRETPWIGKRVVGEINIGCGACPTCRAGVKEHCPSRTVLGIRGRTGAFAEFLSLPSANLHVVPDAVANGTAVFVEPVAAAARILEQVQLTASSHVAVLGDGRMGLIVAQVLQTVSRDVTVLGRHRHKLEVARALGLRTARVEEVVHRFDVVVDVTGRADGLRTALDLVRPRGTVVMKTTAHGEAPFTAWPAVVHEVTLIGSRCGPFGIAIGLLASGAVQVRPLVTHVAPLEDYASAFDLARRALKVLFAISS